MLCSSPADFDNTLNKPNGVCNKGWEKGRLSALYWKKVYGWKSQRAYNSVKIDKRTHKCKEEPITYMALYMGWFTKTRMWPQ